MTNPPIEPPEDLIVEEDPPTVLATDTIEVLPEPPKVQAQDLPVTPITDPVGDEHLEEDLELPPSSEASVDPEDDMVLTDSDEAEGDDEITFDPAIALSKIFLEAESIQDLQTAFNKRLQLLGQDEYARRANDPSTYEHDLVRLNSENSLEAQRAHDALELVKNREALAAVYRDEATKLGLGIKTIKSTFPEKATRVKGAQGLAEFARLTEGVVTKRIPLYNSGFLVDICSPTNVQLHALITEAYTEGQTYGRLFGYPFYMHSDLLMKESLWKLIVQCITRSNLKNWDKPEVLAAHVSIHDYYLILMAIAGAMYPKGFDNFRHPCTNPEGCDHIEQITADLGKFIKTNFLGIPNDCIRYLIEAKIGKDVTADQYTQYHTKLGFTKVVKFNNVHFTLKVPSIKDYMEAGRRYNSDMLRTIQAEDLKAVEASTLYRFNRIFAAWVTEVSVQNGDSENERLITTDRNIIDQQLDIVQTRDKEHLIENAILTFINETQLTHIVYPTYTCPKCGHVPNTKTGYFSLDPQRAFFTLTLRILAENS